MPLKQAALPLPDSAEPLDPGARFAMAAGPSGAIVIGGFAMLRSRRPGRLSS
jgi:hypothetical protein